MAAKQKPKPKTKPKAGRPTDFDPKYLPFVKEMALLGAKDPDFANAFGVNVTTIHRWSKKWPAFCTARKLGKDEADELVVQSLFKRATGYSQPDLDIRTVSIGDGMSRIVQTPIIKHYPPDATSCIFWLKNRRPKEWRDRHELTGKDGAPVADAKFDPNKLSIAELLQLKEMIEKAKGLPVEEKKT